jgi:threonine synthase
VVDAGDRVVVVATGTGLKDTASAGRTVDGVVPVDPADGGVPEDL